MLKESLKIFAVAMFFMLLLIVTALAMAFPLICWANDWSPWWCLLLLIVMPGLYASIPFIGFILKKSTIN
jgi:hypothetical protein